MSYKKNSEKEFEEEIRTYILDTIDEYEDTLCDNLHHELFNTNYWIIGTYACKEELAKIDVFSVLNAVRTYEKEHFGETITDIGDPEKLLNMYAYIIGEQVLNESDTFSNADWDEPVKDYIDDIKKELRSE